jgi:hypothetical protein
VRGITFRQSLPLEGAKSNFEGVYVFLEINRRRGLFLPGIQFATLEG